jgi:hypothetical protein
MDPIRAGRPLIDYIKLCYQGNVPALLVGAHGVGKSDLVQQAVREMNIGCIIRDLSLMEPADLTGLPKAKGHTTVYLPPEFLPRSGAGLLVIEELNRAERYMRAPCLQLLTERALNDYRLPPGWLPIAAVNPSGEEYQVDDLDPALLSRFARVQVLPDRREWLDWARRSGVHAAVLSYVEADTTVFDQPESNPRSWKRVSDLLTAAGKLLSDGATLRAAIIGQVGDVRGRLFIASLKKQDGPLTAKEVLSSYPRFRERVRAWIAKDGRLDLVQATVRAVCLQVQPETDYERLRKNPKHWRNLGTFFADLPGDLLTMAREVFSGRGYEFPNAMQKEKS